MYARPKGRSLRRTSVDVHGDATYKLGPLNVLSWIQASSEWSPGSWNGSRPKEKNHP